MKKLILYVFGTLFVLSIQAAHIVGGEIEFVTIEPGRYRVSLFQYKDEAQTFNQTYDPDITLALYSNLDDREVRTFFLPRLDIQDVAYTNEDCAISELQTSKIVYSAEFELNPQDFGDLEGYYLVYERCCRNGGFQGSIGIGNILNPGETGMKYVLEIPPLWKDGVPYINSSPVLLKPLSDYACINQLYYTNFIGTDLDGDSLVYRMVTPLNSHLFDPTSGFVPPSPKPHIPVAWAGDFSLQNVVPGNPSLSISGRGLLTVNPSETGLFVFSVMVEEWRDQEKIGEVQRDFQMLVVDGCNPPEPPVVGVKIPNDTEFDPLVDTLTYSLSDDKCFDFVITNITAGETINLRAEPVNFEGELEDIFSITQSFVQSGQDTLIVQVCAPGCPPVRDGPFIIDLIAGDDACPLPQLDTVRLTINVEPPPNDFPIVVNSRPGITLNESENGAIGFTITDIDLDSMEINIVIPGIDDPSAKGVFLDISNNERGNIQGAIRWETDCQKYDFGDSPNFRVGIQVDDLDTCGLENPNTSFVNMSIILPVNSSPLLSADVNSALTLSDGETLEMDVSVNDADGDTVFMTLLNRDVLESLGLAFSDTSGIGSAVSPLSWEIDCDIVALTNKRDFELVFVAEDLDRCEEVNQDTLRFDVVIDFPENATPIFDIIPDTVIEINQLFELNFSSVDPDSGDSVHIEWFNAARLPRSPSLNLETVSGLGEASAKLTWTPECSLLDFGETSEFIDLIFLTYDDGCPAVRFDTTKITVEVRETRESFMRFEPANVFTPNGDGFNDVFTLVNLPQPQQNLPPDNCDDAFLYISIFDRSGVQVFESSNREFVWDGDNKPSGVYYYLIKFEKTDYKGWLQVLR